MIEKNISGRLKVAVLLGGDSPERDVSIATGMEVAKALKGRGHDVSLVDPALGEGEQYGLGESSIEAEPPTEVPSASSMGSLDWLGWESMRRADLAFIALHGGKGENGTVQALLDAAGYLYTGAGVLGSALAMDKDRSKAVMREAGVHTARHILFTRRESEAVSLHAEKLEEEIGFPLVVKPNSQGSSVGFSFVEEYGQMAPALEKGFEYDPELIVEQYVPGRELTVAVLGDMPLSPVEIIPKGGFYNYKCKYTKGCSKYVVPAEIDPVCAETLKAEAMLVFGALKCRDYARVDFRVDKDDSTFCLELNTLPGMTGLSLVPMAAADAGIPFDLLVERICYMALSRRGTRNE